MVEIAYSSTFSFNMILSTVNGEGGFANLTSMSSVSYGCRLCTTNCYTCQSFLVSAGVPVALQIAGMYGSMGEFDLQLFFAALPSNDNFEDRVVLLGPTVINGSTIGATREPFEPYIGFGASASVWYVALSMHFVCFMRVDWDCRLVCNNYS
jgi:hypothetical protein